MLQSAQRLPCSSNLQICTHRSLVSTTELQVGLTEQHLKSSGTSNHERSLVLFGSSLMWTFVDTSISEHKEEKQWPVKWQKKILFPTELPFLDLSDKHTGGKMLSPPFPLVAVHKEENICSHYNLLRVKSNVMISHHHIEFNMLWMTEHLMESLHINIPFLCNKMR